MKEWHKEKGKKNTKVKRLRDVYGIRNHAIGRGGDSKISGEEPPLEVPKYPR